MLLSVIMQQSLSIPATLKFWFFSEISDRHAVKTKAEKIVSRLKTDITLLNCVLNNFIIQGIFLVLLAPVSQ